MRIVGLLGIACAACTAPAPGSPPSSAPAAPKGRLAPEIIQRTVRANYGAFRHCYELGLVRDRNLTGRVTARFVIGRDGVVEMVADGGSDLPDPEAKACVLNAFTRIRFPAPDDGKVTVVYPIMLEPADPPKKP